MLIQSFGPLLVAPSEELDSRQTAGYKRNDWNRRRSSDGTLNGAPYKEYPHPHLARKRPFLWCLKKNMLVRAAIGLSLVNNSHHRYMVEISLIRRKHQTVIKHNGNQN